MALAFEQYGNNEGSSVTKTRKKAKVHIDVEAMAAGYLQMADINKEEAQAGKNTLNDGMDFYGNW